MRKVKNWSKLKKNHDKETPKTFSICDLLKDFFEAAPKENLRNYQRKPKHCRKSVSSNDKVISVQLLVQSDGEIYCCC